MVSRIQYFTTPLQSSTADRKRIFLQAKSIWGSSRDREHSPRLLGPAGKFEKWRVLGAPKFRNSRFGFSWFCGALPARSVAGRVDEKQFWHLKELQSIKELIFVEGNFKGFLLSLTFRAGVAESGLGKIPEIWDHVNDSARILDPDFLPAWMVAGPLSKYSRNTAPSPAIPATATVAKPTHKGE